MKKWVYVEDRNEILIAKLFENPKKVFDELQKTSKVGVIRTINENERQVVYKLYE